MANRLDLLLVSAVSAALGAEFGKHFTRHSQPGLDIRAIAGGGMSATNPHVPDALKRRDIAMAPALGDNACANGASR